MIGQTNAKIGSKINGIVKEYVVNTGNTIAKGDFVSLVTSIPSGGSAVGANTVDNYYSRTPCSIGLSDTRMVFIDFLSNSYYLQARVGVVNDKTITLQTSVYIQTSQCSSVDAVKIDDTHVFVRFYNNSNTTARECILTINANNTISVGAQNSISATKNIKLTLVDTNKILGYYESYKNGAWNKLLIITTISGNTITNGSPVSINNIKDGDFTFPSISILETNKILITYINSSSFVCARILNISGSTISLGTEYVIENSQTCANASCVKYSDTIAYVFYTYVSDSYSYPRYKKLTISGNNISSGSVTNLTTSYQFPYLGSIQINDTQCCIFNARSNTRYLFIINILDSALEIDKIASGSGTIYSPRYSLMTPEKLVRSYCAGSNPYTEYTNVITVPTDKIISYDGTNAGVAKSGGSAGETIKVFMPE